MNMTLSLSESSNIAFLFLVDGGTPARCVAQFTRWTTCHLTYPPKPTFAHLCILLLLLLLLLLLFGERRDMLHAP